MTTDNPALQCLSFTQGDAPESFAAAMDIRTRVFVQEQAVPEELEADEFDETATHFLLLKEGAPVATGRILDFQELCQSRPVAKLGRIAVLKSYRGQGLGDVLMRHMLDFAQKQGYEQAVLDSQTSALGFYTKHDFVKEGFEFEDAGIPHFTMRRIF